MATKKKKTAKKKAAEKAAAPKMTWETWRRLGIMKQLEISQAWLNKTLVGKVLFVEPCSFYDLIKDGSTEGFMSTSPKDIAGSAFSITLGASQLTKVLNERDVIGLYEDVHDLDA